MAELLTGREDRSRFSDMTAPAAEQWVQMNGDAAGRAPSRRGFLASLGAVSAAVLASLCCVGPLLFVTLGVGAGLGSTFKPLRPVFIVLTLGFLAAGFYVVYFRKRADTGAACAPDGSCAVPRSRTRDRVLLWIATVLALVLLTFPQWSILLV